jgi:hypothetical protein
MCEDEISKLFLNLEQSYNEPLSFCYIQTNFVYSSASRGNRKRKKRSRGRGRKEEEEEEEDIRGRHKRET